MKQGKMNKQFEKLIRYEEVTLQNVKEHFKQFSKELKTKGVIIDIELDYAMTFYGSPKFNCTSCLYRPEFQSGYMCYLMIQIRRVMDIKSDDLEAYTFGWPISHIYKNMFNLNSISRTRIPKKFYREVERHVQKILQYGYEGSLALLNNH